MKNYTYLPEKFRKHIVELKGFDDKLGILYLERLNSPHELTDQQIIDLKETLTEMHKIGIVHDDIERTQNFMVRDDGTVVLIDFDQSKELDDTGYDDALNEEIKNIDKINNVIKADTKAGDPRKARKKAINKKRRHDQQLRAKKRRTNNDTSVNQKLFF